MLVENALGGKTKDPFWNTQATALIAMLITILKKHEIQYQNLYNVRQLLNRLGSNPDSIDNIFKQYADDILFDEYKSFIAYDEKVISGVIATCKAALQIFSDAAVARVTSIDSLDLADFRNRQTVLFIQNSVADQKYYSVLTSIFFEQLFAHILSRFPDDKEADIFLMIDEASSLYLPNLQIAVANVRKHRSGIMLLVQDFSQLIHIHGTYNANGIRSNCFAKMFLTGASHETSKELEQVLGKYEYEDEKKRTQVYPLMSMSEIRTMDTNRALLVCGHHPPIIAKLRPYYKNLNYRNYSKIPAPLVGQDTLPENIPLLPLNSNNEPKR